MAEKLLKLSHLQLIKNYIDNCDSEKFESGTYDEDTRVVSFYKSSNTSGEPDFTFTLPADVDISDKADKVSPARAGDLAGLDASGNLTDSGIAATVVTGHTTAITTLNGDADTEGSVAKSIKDAIDALDSTSSGEGTFVKGVTQTNGEVEVTMGSIAASEVPEITLSKISDAGTAAKADKATAAIVKNSTDNNLVSAAQVSSFVATEIADLAGAMHFRGVVTRQSEAETDQEAIARTITEPKAGDVCVMSHNAKEYLYGGGAWRDIGDETLYVQKSTTIAGVDLQNNITKTELLTALNVEDGADVNAIDSASADFTITAGKELQVASGKKFMTTAQSDKLDDIAVSTTDNSVTDGTNTISGILTSSDYVTASDADVIEIFPQRPEASAEQ